MENKPAEDNREWSDDADNFEGCVYVVEGEVEMGPQEHLYMETQAAVCVPGEDDEWLEISLFFFNHS